MYSNIKKRNINICILFLLMLNFSIAHGDHQRLLYNSPECKEKKFTENCRLLLALCHLKKCCGVKNLVPLEGNTF